jgi:cytochrome c-type biogenesis protein CcmE
MTKKSRNRLIVLLLIPAIIVIAVAGLLVFQELQPLPLIRPLPQPNGYVGLVQAGGMISQESWDYEAFDEAQLREIVSANAEALSLARASLSHECRVPVQYSPPYYDKTHLSELAGLKRLAQAFVVEGRFAEKQRSFGDAAGSYLDLIRLGHNSARGGILIDGLVGLAIENMGVAGLQKIIGQLDAKSCREAAATLEALDAQRQSWTDILQQEHAWSRRAYPGIKYRLGGLVMSSSLKKAEQQAGQKFKGQERKTRQVIIDLAARACELEKGRRPASLTDLVPNYLRTIPQDPLTGKDMVYSPQ